MDEQNMPLRIKNKLVSENNEPFHSPFHGAAALGLKMEVDDKWNSPYESDHHVEFEACDIKTEEVDVSDVEVDRLNAGCELETDATQLDCESSVNARDFNTGEKPGCEFKATSQQQSEDATTEDLPAVFSCSLCKFGFTSKVYRDRHQRLSCRRREQRLYRRRCRSGAQPLPETAEPGTELEEPERKKRLKCTECDYTTDKRTNLKRHFSTHKDPRNFACSQCYFKCRREWELLQHLLTHGDAKPFACPMCDYRTARKVSLTKHLRLHTGDKPFKCSECDYASIESSNLMKHVRAKHTKERPFGCTQCEYTCVSSSQLASHILTHSGLKKLSCAECSYKCNRVLQLKYHMSSKHGAEKRLSCLYCHYKADRTWDMNNHLVAKHNA